MITRIMSPSLRIDLAIGKPGQARLYYYSYINSLHRKIDDAQRDEIANGCKINISHSLSPIYSVANDNGVG